MSKGGHILTGIALGAALYHAAPKAPLLAGAAIIGALFPDAAEGVVGWWGSVRWSIIPHRTLTHWIYLYAALFFMAHRFAPIPHAIAIGVCAGAALHIAIDAFSPMGIPLANPFGERTSITLPGGSNLYSTGGLGELPILLVVFACAGAFFFWH